MSSQKGGRIKNKIYVLRKDRRSQVSAMGWSLDGDDLLEGTPPKAHLWVEKDGQMAASLPNSRDRMVNAKRLILKMSERAGVPPPREHSVRRQRLHCSS